MDWLNYHHLLYFWTVAKEGSLRRAASKLHVSEPSISSQTRQLEEALGAKLFLRHGRSRILTNTGRFVMDYAESIFSLGSEMLASVKQQNITASRALRLTIGVEDSFPKILSYELLKPILGFNPPMHLVCREGKAEELVAQLAIHRLDAVLTDEPGVTGYNGSLFSHFLGESGIAICAAGTLAARLRKGFPRSLHGAPALLPTANTTMRRSMDEWMHSIGVRPVIAAEFEDGAMLKIAAADGQGFAPVPSVSLHESTSRFGLKCVGRTTRCVDRFFLLTSERRSPHPGVSLILEHARSLVFT